MPVIARWRARLQPLRDRVVATTAGRAALRFQRLRLRDGAATITYYAMLSLFPALLFGASLAGIVGGRGLIEDAQQAAQDAGLGARGAAGRRRRRGPRAEQLVGRARHRVGDRAGARALRRVRRPRRRRARARRRCSAASRASTPACCAGAPSCWRSPAAWSCWCSSSSPRTSRVRTPPRISSVTPPANVWAVLRWPLALVAAALAVSRRLPLGALRARARGARRC